MAGTVDVLDHDDGLAVSVHDEVAELSVVLDGGEVDVVDIVVEGGSWPCIRSWWTCRCPVDHGEGSRASMPCRSWHSSLGSC